jgi:hypothetical protein
MNRQLGEINVKEVSERTYMRWAAMFGVGGKRAAVYEEHRIMALSGDSLVHYGNVLDWLATVGPINPKNIVNIDETNIQLSATTGKIIGVVGHEAREKTVSDKRSFTMVAAITPGGPVDLVPIFPSQHVPDEWRSFALARKEGSWMDKEQFYAYCNHLFPLMR